MTVIRTPGHSHDSVCFYTGSALISGDTLFNGTIGNCFTGDLKGFLPFYSRSSWPSPQRRWSMRDMIMCGILLPSQGHLEPGNPEIERFRASYDPNHVCSSLAEEFKVNPYLRFDEAPIVDLLKKKGLPHETQWERWQSLMSIE